MREEGGELTDPPETGESSLWGAGGSLSQATMRQVNRHSPVFLHCLRRTSLRQRL